MVLDVGVGEEEVEAMGLAVAIVTVEQGVHRRKRRRVVYINQGHTIMTLLSTLIKRTRGKFR